MTENQKNQIDKLIQIWDEMPTGGKLVLTKDKNDRRFFHLQHGDEIADVEYPQVVHRFEKIELLTVI
jgi:hypothetical protein